MNLSGAYQKTKCPACGNDFKRGKNPAQRLCSSECAVKWRSIKANVTRVCAYCKKEYTGLYCKNPKYCSRECVTNRRKEGREGWEINAIRQGIIKVVNTSEWKERHAAGARAAGITRRGTTCSPEAIQKRAKALRGKMQTAQKTKRGVTNHRAVTYHLRDPNGKSHHGKNLLEFVRKHEHLFLEDDVIWRPISPKKSALTCRAYNGLCSLKNKARTPGTWKGWTIASLVETFHNGGEDLLERK
jgi:hypothetical protein